MAKQGLQRQFGSSLSAGRACHTLLSGIEVVAGGHDRFSVTQNAMRACIIGLIETLCHQLSVTFS